MPPYLKVTCLMIARRRRKKIGRPRSYRVSQLIFLGKKKLFVLVPAFFHTHTLNREANQTPGANPPSLVNPGGNPNCGVKPRGQIEKPRVQTKPRGQKTPGTVFSAEKPRGQPAVPGVKPRGQATLLRKLDRHRRFRAKGRQPKQAMTKLTRFY